jgi:hypothetical protein
VPSVAWSWDNITIQSTVLVAFWTLSTGLAFRTEQYVGWRNVTCSVWNSTRMDSQTAISVGCGLFCSWNSCSWKWLNCCHFPDSCHSDGPLADSAGQRFHSHCDQRTSNCWGSRARTWDHHFPSIKPSVEHTLCWQHGEPAHVSSNV